MWGIFEKGQKLVRDGGRAANVGTRKATEKSGWGVADGEVGSGKADRTFAKRKVTETASPNSPPRDRHGRDGQTNGRKDERVPDKRADERKDGRTNE